MRLLAKILSPRLRGFRLIDLVALGCLVVLAAGVYLAKAGAGRENAALAEADKRIGEEGRRVRLLRAELARLEQPARLERLAAYLNLHPANSAREAQPSALGELAQRAAPAPPAPVETAR